MMSSTSLPLFLSSCGADSVGSMMSNEAVLATLSPNVRMGTMRYEVGSRIKQVVVQAHVLCLFSIATAPRRNHAVCGVDNHPNSGPRNIPMTLIRCRPALGRGMVEEFWFSRRSRKNIVVGGSAGRSRFETISAHGAARNNVTWTRPDRRHPTMNTTQ